MSASRFDAFAGVVLPRLPQGSRVLEIGCGKGELAALFRAKRHYVVAVDPKAPEGVDALRMPFESFSTPPKYFDAVVMQLVLHHVDDLEATLDRIAATLKRDGFIAIDDYGWERAGDEVDAQWRAGRADLHTSAVMLKALRKRFVQERLAYHAYFQDGAGTDKVAFTFVGTPAPAWPRLIGGREKRKVVLAEYNPEWRVRFEVERRRIVTTLGSRVKQIEHVGSTAVPGLAAKPIVDIVVSVDDPLDDEIRAALEAAGFQLRVEEPDHRMFRTSQLDVHVHLWHEGAAEIDRLLAFRDRLRNNDTARITYERVKRELAKRDWADMNDYAQAKSAVVAQILSRTGG